MKKKKNKTHHNSLKELIDWQNHQYDPGYYTGGNIPPYLKKKKSQKRLGWLFILFGNLLLVSLILALILGFDFKQLGPIVIGMIFWGGISIITIYAGLKMLKDNRL